jgi:hypothetical protein
VSAVFDWGGGSLDIATVEIENGVALTKSAEGWHHGGEQFDRLICLQALQDFLRANPQVALTAEEILETRNRGRGLQLRAERCKIEVPRRGAFPFQFIGLVGSANLNYMLQNAAFEEWITRDVTQAIHRLQRAIRDTGISPGQLARLFLSGGTCNLPYIQRRLEREVAGGGRIVTQIAIPQKMQLNSGGLDDIGNATAVGAVLLAAHGAAPVFAGDVGVRLANGQGAEDRFYPVFRAGEAVSTAPRTVKFFVSDSSSGVARLLVCDRHDAILQPQGRLLRVIPVPIDPKENWLDVHFTVDPHLVLSVEATGRMKQAAHDRVWIQQLNLGFKMP